MSEPVFDQIRKTIEENDVVLYMKGVKHAPMCGFSGGAVQILQLMGAEFKDVNVLADPEIRQGIKDFSNWPTIPQIYVKGEFVGGFDILKEMYEAGELKPYLQEKGVI
jgi:monothiol glutaredoxin